MDSMFTIPGSWTPIGSRVNSPSALCAFTELQKRFPGMRATNPTFYAVPAPLGSSQSARLAVVADILCGLELVSRVAVIIVPSGLTSPRRRWAVEKIEYLSFRDAPVTRDEAERAASKLMREPCLCGRPLDPELASRVADLLMDAYGAVEEVNGLEEEADEEESDGGDEEA